MMGLTNTAGTRGVWAVASTRRSYENARQSQAANWRVASSFPLVNYLPVAPPCTSLSANSSIMLRSYSSIVSILSPWMPAMRSRRRVRVPGARRVRAVIFCEGLRGLREHNGEVVGDAAWPAIIDRATHDRLVGLLDDPSRRRENTARPTSDMTRRT
jgi:hypothetical protein